MAEWSKAVASKAIIPDFPGSGVRIPLSPGFAKAKPGLGEAFILLNRFCLKLDISTNLTLKLKRSRIPFAKAKPGLGVALRSKKLALSKQKQRREPGVALGEDGRRTFA